jgi:hypothetical protein
MIESDQIYILPAKFFELILYSIVLFSLNKKHKGEKFSKRPPLHRYFVFGIAGWIFYMILDSIIFAIAPLSLIEPVTPGLIQGYSSTYPSLFIANVLRDFGIIGAIFTAWFYCMAAVQINSGFSLNRKIFGSNKKILTIKDFTLTWGHIASFFAVLVVLTFIFLDQIKIEIIDPTTIHVSSDWGIAMLFILALYGTSTLLMVYQLIKIRKTPMEPEYKQRASYLGWSIIIFTSGILYWALTGSLLGNYEKMKQFSLVFFYIGHIIWMISAVFVFQAFKGVKSNSEISEEE